MENKNKIKAPYDALLWMFFSNSFYKCGQSFGDDDDDDVTSFRAGAELRDYRGHLPPSPSPHPFPPRSVK